MMKDIIKIIAKIFACFILISFIVVTCFPRVSTQKLTPEGEYLFSIKSPYDEKKVNIYLFNGGATTSYYIRGEVEYKNGKKRNIYFNADEETAKVKWLNKNSLIINGHLIKNINYDFYNFKFDIK